MVHKCNLLSYHTVHPSFDHSSFILRFMILQTNASTYLYHIYFPGLLQLNLYHVKLFSSYHLNRAHYFFSFTSSRFIFKQNVPDTTDHDLTIDSYKVMQYLALYQSSVHTCWSNYNCWNSANYEIKSSASLNWLCARTHSSVVVTLPIFEVKSVCSLALLDFFFLVL